MRTRLVPIRQGLLNITRGSNGARRPLGVSFFHIFLHTKKDMAPGGRQV